MSITKPADWTGQIKDTRDTMPDYGDYGIVRYKGDIWVHFKNNFNGTSEIIRPFKNRDPELPFCTQTESKTVNTDDLVRIPYFSWRE